MLAQARDTAISVGLQLDEPVWVPGSMEKPLALKKALKRADIVGAVTLGIIERGETGPSVGNDETDWSRYIGARNHSGADSTPA